MESVSLWEEGDVPCPGTDVPVLEDDPVSDAEEKEEFCCERQQEDVQRCCVPGGHLQSCRRGGREPQAAWGALRELHGCANLVPNQEAIFGFCSAFLTPVGKREVHNRLLQHLTEWRNRRRLWDHREVFLLSNRNWLYEIWTVYALELPRQKLAVFRGLSEDKPSRQLP